MIKIVSYIVLVLVLAACMIHAYRKITSLRSVEPLDRAVNGDIAPEEGCGEYLTLSNYASPSSRIV